MTFFEELKRRNVVKVAVVYLISSWLLLQVTDVLSSLLPVPEWAGSLVVMLLVLGFFPAIIFSWVYEMTPEGLKREKEIDRSQSITSHTGRKINILIVTLLVLAIAAVAVDRLIPEGERVASGSAGGGVSDEGGGIEAVVDETLELEADPASLAAGKFAPAPERSIAVLPFVNMSGSQENEYFSDGLTEELLNVLAKMDGLRVAARTSSFRFKGEVGDPAEIGRTLNVNHLLEGSVRQSGDRIRITAQLINAGDGYHLWSETYDRTLDDVFAIQDEISKSVASALQVKLLGVSAESVPAPIPTQNMDAYNAYLRGTQFLAGTGIEAYRSAEAMFEQAIALDPEFAAAHAGLARSWAELAQWGTLSWPNIIGDVQEQVEKALALDPDLPLAWSMQGYIDYFEDPDKPDRAASEASLRRALELEPGNAFASEALAAVLNELGRRQEAVLMLQKAIDRDPLSVNLRRRMANLQEALAEFDAAEANYRMATDLAPDDPAARMAYADFKWRRGELAEATLLTDRAVALDPLDPEAPFSMTVSYLHLGDDQAAERWLAESLRLNPEAEVSRVGPALLAYRRGQDAQALEIARNNLDAFPGNRFNAEIIALIIVRDVSLAQGDVATAQRALEGYRPGVTAVDFTSDIGLDDVYGRVLALPVIAARDGRELATPIAEELLQGLQMNRWGFSPVSAGDIRAAIYAFLGDAQAAVESMRERQRLATKDLPWFWWKRDSLYAPIQGDPAYQTFMAELNAEIAEQLRMLRASGQPEPPRQ